MKRPWTPKPWLIEGRTIYALQPCPNHRKGMPEMVNRWFAGFSLMNGGAPIKEVEACALLASKAPDMAELLIRLVEGSTCIDRDTFHDLLLDTVALLGKIGYNLKVPYEVNDEK